MSRILAWGAWFLALFFLWLLLAGEWNRTEWVAAATAAAVGAALAELARARLDPPLPPLGAVAEVPGLLVAVVVDFAIVVRALVGALARGRVVRGEFAVRERDDLRGTGDAVARRRTWTALAATYSPNAYVLEIDAGDGSVLLHHLVPRRASERPV